MPDPSASRGRATDPATALGRQVANRLLEDEAWARDKLRAHAGRGFALSCGPIVAAFLIRDDGTLDAADTATNAPSLQLRVSPFDVPALLADPTRWATLVASTGDEALASTLGELAVTLPWFVERGFAKAFGPVAGQRLADTGRRLLGFPEYAGSRVAASVASFARDESGALARGDEVRTFAEQGAEVATRVDALAERIADLEARLDAGTPPPH